MRVGSSEFKKWLEMIIKRRREQKLVAITYKAKIYTNACYFAMKIVPKSYQKRNGTK